MENLATETKAKNAAKPPVAKSEGAPAAEKTAKTPRTKKGDLVTAAEKGKAAAAKSAPAPATKKADLAPKAEKVLVYKRMPKGEEKLPAQASKILAVLKDKGPKLALSDLVTALEPQLETKQPVGRIVSFYQKTLVDGGYIEIK